MQRSVQLNCGRDVDIDRMIIHDDNPNQGFLLVEVEAGHR